ncbi:heavy metal sensor histidine kinase [Vibrio paucivorans]
MTTKNKTSSMHSIATRLILSYFSASLLVLCVLSATTLYAVRYHFAQQDYSILQASFNTINKLQSEDNFILKFGEFFEASEIKLWLLADERLIYSSQKIPLPMQLEVSNSDTFIEWSLEGTHYRALKFTLDDRPGVYAVLGVSTNAHHVFIRNFANVLLLTTIIASIISGLLGWLIVRRELSPLRRLEQHIKAITPQKLDLRIPNQHFPQELIQLVIGFNDMLDRLEGDFERLSEFSSDIAHELRTPVGNMMTQTQVALSKPRSNEEYQDILVSNVEELNRITKTITDMLYLAKSEHNLLLKTNEPIALSNMVEELIEFYEMAGDDKALTFSQSGDAEIVADKSMVKRALSNLLSNAVRHSRSNSNIDVAITQTQTSSEIAITNHGDTIAAESIPMLFERFYRADKSRQHNSSSGAGLGLPITCSIAKMHHGDVSVESSDGVTTFTLKLANKS